MAEITGHDKRTIFRSLDRLEKLRLIERQGMGKNRKFLRGSILNKILTTVTFRIKKELNNISTTATLCHKKLNNRDMVSYKKTSLSLKHKEGEKFSNPNRMAYQEYFGRIKSDINLGLLKEDTKILSPEEWLLAQYHKTL